jgi:hypothetical protein
VSKYWKCKQHSNIHSMPSGSNISTKTGTMSESTM